jgi:hypothetical protein
MIKQLVSDVSQLGILGVLVHLCPGLCPSLANTVAIQYNSAGSSNSGARNRLYSTQPLLLPQQSQMSEYWERNIPGGSQSTQFGLGLGVSDTEDNVLVPATQY